MNKEYLDNAKKSGFSHDLINKLISLGRFEEALAECEKNKGKDSFEDLDNKKIEILKKLGRSEELKKLLFEMIKKTGDLNYVLRLKKESTNKEWQKFLKQIIADTKKKGRNSLLSRIYYNENDFKNAYEHSKDMHDVNYLELLAKKLSLSHSLLSCEIFRKLCFNWINSGSGWPYKKAGKMLESIKILDKKGKFFEKTKKEIISLHKNKYSLMEIIESV